MLTGMDAQIMIQRPVGYVNDVSAQIRQSALTQAAQAENQIKTQQQASEGRVVTVENLEGNTIDADKEGGGAQYEAWENDGGEHDEPENLPTIELGKKVRNRPPNSPHLIDVSI